MEPRPIPGRPRKTTEKTDFLILYQALRDKYASAENIRKTIPELNVSKSTILRRLHEGKRLGSFFALKKPFLNLCHRRKRLQWAKEHQNWSIDDWNRVLWSDETIFQQWSNRRIRIWRPSTQDISRNLSNPLCHILRN